MYGGAPYGVLLLIRFHGRLRANEQRVINNLLDAYNAYVRLVVSFFVSFAIKSDLSGQRDQTYHVSFRI
jgi:hypothetical protein